MTEKAYLSIDDVARHFGFNPSTIYRLVERQELPGFKIGGRWRFSRELLERWAVDRVSIEHLKMGDPKAPSRQQPTVR